MHTKISTTYTKKDTVEFIIDDDDGFKWLSSFKSDSYDRFFVVIDKRVNDLWGKTLLKQLRLHKKQIFVFEVIEGEKGKSLDSYTALVEFLKKEGCGLSDLVVAIGGGVVIDLASFTCSTYMRQLPFCAVPTTLIGQVDASTAGKTCLNSGKTKNLLGTFYYPLWVYNNIIILSRNEPFYERQGNSEIFKYGLLGSKKLLSMIEKNAIKPRDSLLVEIIKETIRVRIKIRKKNPLASNLDGAFLIMSISTKTPKGAVATME